MILCLLIPKITTQLHSESTDLRQRSGPYPLDPGPDVDDFENLVASSLFKDSLLLW